MNVCTTNSSESNGGLNVPDIKNELNRMGVSFRDDMKRIDLVKLLCENIQYVKTMSRQSSMKLDHHREVFRDLFTSLMNQNKHRQHMDAVGKLWYQGKITTAVKDTKMEQIDMVHQKLGEYGEQIIKNNIIIPLNGSRYPITKVKHWTQAIEGLRGFENQFSQISGDIFIKPMNSVETKEMENYCKGFNIDKCKLPCKVKKSRFTHSKCKFPY